MARSGPAMPSDLLHRGGELDDRDRLVAADVDDLALGLRRVERPHEAVDRVGHVGERADLAAVAVELHDPAVEQRLHERRDRPAPPGRVVARAVDVEEPQDRDAQPLLLGERERDVLVVELRDRVGPAARGRRAEHHGSSSANGGVALPYTSEVEVMITRHVERQRDVAGGVRPLDVGLERPQRAAVARDLLRREVHDRVAAGEGAAQVALVAAVERGGIGSWSRTRKPVRLPDEPWERSSTPTTSRPSASSRSHRCEPMKPAAPVTPIRSGVKGPSFARRRGHVGRVRRRAAGGPAEVRPQPAPSSASVGLAEGPVVVGRSTGGGR